uniref:Reverse transcriptase domain-containing protein n=1 Tax=Trichobilharzia regenti TaxID=157069 RepID=A0AA85KEV2_TRIRE|nr:unnamed protein product [Trichobilharzia regenti]
MKASQLISGDIYDQIRPTGSIIPRLYGLPKVHKVGLPLRPILDMSGSPYHSIAQWLADILEPVRKQLCTYSLRDTFQFIECIQDTNVSNKIMLSFDIESLFTNVPLTETVCFICRYIDDNHLDIGIPTTYLKELLLRCTLNVQFTFNDTIYRQKDGIAMGSPLGPLLSDCFVASLERGSLKPSIDNLRLYKRYVDDIFIICDNNNDPNLLLKTFNNCHPAIKFTLEMENESKIPFLDVELTRRADGSLRRSIHRKPTWNGQLTSFYSWVPIQQKRNLIKSLATRIRRICSPDVLETELDILREIFIQNGYPIRFIDKNMKPIIRKNETLTAPKKKIYMNLDFKGDLASDILKRRITSSLRRTFFAATLRIVFSSRPLICRSLKDKIPHLATSMCIYQFTCCCGARYIGRSTRILSKRIQEHYPAWLRKGNTGAIRSAIIEHLVNTDHCISTNASFKVIYRVKNNISKAIRFRLLCIAEALAIHMEKPELCIQKKITQPLLLSW